MPDDDSGTWRLVPERRGSQSGNRLLLAGEVTHAFTELHEGVIAMVTDGVTVLVRLRSQRSPVVPLGGDAPRPSR